MLKEYFVLGDALSKLKPEEFIFASEKDHSNSKQTFCVATHIDFITHYEFVSNKRYHEYKFPNRPIKPFLDLESCDLSAQQFSSEVNLLLSKLKEYGTPIIINSSREGKHSLHVIFYLSVCVNIYEVKKTITKIKSPILDMQVYKPGTLRLPYSTSFRSFPHILSVNGELYDRENLKKGMLHYFEFTLDYGISSVLRTTTEHEQTQMYDAILYNWAQKQGWSIVNYKEEESTIKLLLKGVTCPKIGRVHKSNNFYLRIDLDSPEFPSLLGCLDCECTNVKFDGPKFSTILKPDEIKNQLLLLLS